MSALNETIKETGNVADKLTTTQEEYNDQISDRHKNDMHSDNWLSKSIRPITLLWLLSLFTWSLVYTQVTDKEPNLTFINLLSSLLTTAIMFYFGSKAAERISTIIAKRNDKISKIITRKSKNRLRRLFNKK